MDVKELLEDYKGGMGIYDVCAKYHIGKLKLKKILSDNGVELRKKGKQPMDKSEFVVSDYRVKKYKELQGFHYVAVDKNDGTRYNDHMNSAGCLTTHIEKVYGIPTPTLYDRRIYYMKTGNYWWEQWFDIIEERDVEKTMKKTVKQKKKAEKIVKIDYEDLEFGFLREDTRRANFKGSDDIYHIKRTGLEVYLGAIFPNVNDWIHDEAIGDINGVKYRYRPDYRSETLKMVIEFDGIGHYNDPNTILDDARKTSLYESAGYKVIRIPYFIQLTNDVVNQMFGVNVEMELFTTTVASMSIRWKNTPAFLCHLGVERMAKEITKYPQQMEINLSELKQEEKLYDNGKLLSGHDLLLNEIKKETK